MYLAPAFGHQPIHTGKPRKITPIQRDEIAKRRYHGENPRALALEFGVSAAYIRNSITPIEN